MAQAGPYTASNNAGELMPELYGRTDIKQFYSGLSRAVNIEPVPQSGSRLSPRSRFLGRIRRVLEPVTIGAVTFNAGPWSVAATVMSATFAPQAVAVVVIPDLSATQELSGLLQVEYLVGASWTALGDPLNVGTSPATHTRTLAPGETFTCSGLRLRLTGAPPSATTFTAADMTAHIEGDDLSAVRLKPFTFSLDETYVAAMVDNHADFYRDGDFVGGAQTGLTEDRTRTADSVQRFDTMMLFHEDVPGVRIKRDGSDGRWPRDTVPFTDIPQVDLGGLYDNAVTDKWEIYLRYPTSGTYANGANLFLSVTVDGEETPGVATGGTPSWPDFADDVKAAIEALPSMASGITVTENHATSGLTILTVEFTGAGNTGEFLLVAAVVNTADAAATVTHTQIGIEGGEPIMSDSAGYSACAGFDQDRLITGGFKSKKSALAWSRTGEYFDLNTRSVSAAAAILHNLDTDGSEKLHRMRKAGHMVLFTTDAEYFVSTRPLNRNQPVNVVECSRNGAAVGVPVVQSESTLIYFASDKEDPERKGVLAYSMAYDDVAQKYISDPLSLLAAHIVTGVVDAALQRIAGKVVANRLWAVRDDGTMAVGVMIRNQEVTAFVRWETDGDVKAVCVDGLNVPHIVVRRAVGDGFELHLERLELGLIFDGTVEQTFEAPVTLVPNLDMHEGAQVWAKADGFVVGPFTVTDGTITLSRPASSVSVGRWTPPVARLLPIPRDVSDRVELRRPIRVHTVTVDTIDTTSIAIGANGVPAEDVPLLRAGDPTDAPPPARTGPVVVDGLEEFTDEGIVEITQARPGALQWRKITVEARL